MAHPGPRSQQERCSAEQGWDWEVSPGLGMGTVPFGSEGERAGSFCVHGGCATRPVPAAPEGQLSWAGLGDEAGADSLRWQFPTER